MSSIKTLIKDCAIQVDESMDSLLPPVVKGRVGESRLADAMRYSALSGGKRLRPFLVVESSNLFGVSKSSAMQVASAVEFVHAYSLIHDDLPALDNDDYRRGELSCHKKFDEATAILAGDALLTLAFEIVSDPSTHSSNGVRAELTLAIAKACGINGMIGGQMIDMISEERDLTIEEITRLQRMKTGALFAMSCESGAILGKAAPNLRNALRGYAYDMGLVFQITDDILDAEADAKENRQDKSAEKGTYITAMGIDKAKMQCQILTEQAIRHLNVFDKKADSLRELARFVEIRKS